MDTILLTNQLKFKFNLIYSGFASGPTKCPYSGPGPMQNLSLHLSVSQCVTTSQSLCVPTVTLLKSL
jgi:hypothetical protein